MDHGNIRMVLPSGRDVVRNHSILKHKYNEHIRYIEFSALVKEDEIKYDGVIYTPQELYFFTDDRIREGDWAYDKEQRKVFKCTKLLFSTPHHNVIDEAGNFHHPLDCYRVIATTNQDLWDNIDHVKAGEQYEYRMGKIGRDFVRRFVNARGNVVTALLDGICTCRNCGDEDCESSLCESYEKGHNWRPRIKSNGYVTVKDVRLTLEEAARMHAALPFTFRPNRKESFDQDKVRVYEAFLAGNAYKF